MVYPNQCRALEQEYGEPIEKLLPRLANEYGSIPKMAKALGYSKVAVYGWAKEIGMVKRHCFVIDDEQKRSKSAA